MLYRLDPVFRFQVPEACPQVPPEILWPRDTWRDGRAYDEQARRLAGAFAENFRQFADRVPREVASAGPGN